MNSPKIKDWKGLFAAVKRVRAKGKKIGFTNGCFDIIHAGHVKYLRKAKSECGVLVVGVNSDSSVRRIKGPKRPVNGEIQRMEVLAALESVDLVTLFKEDTPERLIKFITPDMLFKGGDWKAEELAGAAHIKKHGGKVRIIKYIKGQSTTGIIKKIKKKA